MLLSISSQPSRRKDRPRRTLHLRCDVCSREYEKEYFSHIEKAQFHFCSEACQTRAQLKGGVLDLKKRQLFVERYGVESPQRIAAVREKTRLTNLERYGVEVSSQATIVKDRARQTNQKRFGVDWHTQSENFMMKAKATWTANYGVDHPMKSDEVKAKYDFCEIWRKAHETKKLNGTYASSKAENRFHERLMKLFEHVERQVPIQHESGTWLIDFKIGNTYVQFDGEYWHGLDRFVGVIASSSGLRNCAIMRAYERDRVQDAWFVFNGMRLVRITDFHEKTLTDVELQRLLTMQDG